jgi:hypothetical protein
LNFGTGRPPKKRVFESGEGGVRRVFRCCADFCGRATPISPKKKDPEFCEGAGMESSILSFLEGGCSDPKLAVTPTLCPEGREYGQAV